MDLRRSMTPIVGRHAELAALEQLVTGHRLVTIAGPGGSGKTRLAEELHRRSAGGPAGQEDAPPRTHWLDLSSAADSVAVVRACARELDVRLEADGRDPVSTLVARIRTRRLLLVFDTCEHVLDPVAELVERVSADCPGVSVLATSREPLGVLGEAVWRIPPLNIDDATRLFIERARASAYDADLSPHDPIIRAICSRLDGLPLAIELASAWTRMLSPAQILAGLDDRFRLLTGGTHRSVPRHRTLEASMAWSYGLLQAPERDLLRRLAVFVGEFDLAAVDEVCDVAPGEATLEVLARLVDKSLLVANREGDRARFRMLDTVREYAEDRLIEAGDFAGTRDRHLAWCLGRLRTVEELLRSDQDAAMRRFDEIEDEAATALDWALQTDDRRRALGRRLAHLMVAPWFLRSRSDRCRPLLNRAISSCVEPHDGMQALLLADSALLGIVAGRRVPNLARAEAREPTDEDLLARARLGLVRTYEAFFEDHESCEREGLEASALGGRTGDVLVEDFGLIIAAYSLSARERHDDARSLAAPAAARAGARGDRFCLGFASGLESYAAMQSGRIPASIRLGREAIALVAPLGDYFCLGTLTVNLALAVALSGDSDGALRLMEPIVDVTESNAEVDVVGLPVSIGSAYLRAGAWEDAAHWFDRGLARLSDDRPDWTAARCLPGAVEALRRLGRTADAEALFERGRRLSITAPEFVASLAEQGGHLAAADGSAAERLHQRALTVRIRAGLRTFIPDSLDALAGCRAGGHSAEAVRLLAASTAAREAMHYPRTAGGRRDHEASTAELAAALGRTGFDEAWQLGAGIDLDDACRLAQGGRRRPARPATGWASLTAAELRVAELAAQGLANAAIARELVITRATVKTHLYHVFAKLGIANRTELAAIAHAASRFDEPADGMTR